MNLNPNTNTKNGLKNPLTEEQVLKFALGEKTALENSSVNPDMVDDAREGFELWQTEEDHLKKVNTALLQSLTTIVNNKKNKKKRRDITKTNLVIISAAILLVILILAIWFYLQHSHTIKF